MIRRAWLLALVAACGGDDGAAGAPDARALAPTVGPEGGTLTSPDGQAVLTVPAGALLAPAAVSVVSVSVGVLPLNPAAVTGAAYRVLPEDTRFATPATLEVAYDLEQGPRGARDAHLRLFAVATAWTRVEGSTVDAGRHVAAGPVGAGGSYGVAWATLDRRCDTAEDAQFDFWLGSWDHVVNGMVAAPNVITRSADGCAIHEEYMNGFGRSLSFRSDDGRWYQTFITRMSRLPMDGLWDGRRMVLLANPGLRFVWRPVGADVVEYNTETSDDGGATWNLRMATEYRRH